MPDHLATRRERDHDGASIIVIMEATQDRTPHSLYVVCIGAGRLRRQHGWQRSDRRNRDRHQRW